MLPPLHEKFYITGQKKLSGSVAIPGSKNAALPILAATLGVKGISTIENVPHLSDTLAFTEIMKSIGAKVEWKENTVTVDATTLHSDGKVKGDYIQRMRASILFLAPVLARCGKIQMEFPGGCVLGKRSVESHLHAFKSLGARILDTKSELSLELAKKKFIAGSFSMQEMSVTATENAVIAAAFTSGISQIRLCASEPHIQNLCDFLVSAGAKIEGIGSHHLTITGIENPKSATIQVTPDYLQAGTYILAGILTNSQIIVKNVEESHLDSFFQALRETGAQFTIDTKNKSVTTHTKKQELVATNIQTGVFPKFATDLHPQFAVLLTQCEGRSKIFETLFERKFAYLLELEKMGADVEIQNPHVFYITGKTQLQGVPVASQDIRAGAAMLLAALIADGETEISNIHYIHRGYENIEENLRSLGAQIRKES